MPHTPNIRVLHLISTLGLGGAEQLLLTTAKHLDRSQYALRVIALSAPLDLAPDFERIGIPVEHLGLRGSLDWHRGLFRLAGRLKSYRPQILHTHLPYANFYGRLAGLMAGVPIFATTLHSTEYSHWESTRLRFRVRRAIDVAAARWLPIHYLSISECVKEDYRRHVGLSDVDVLYNYIDPSGFGPLAPERSRQIRESFGWGAEAFVLVTIGRCDVRKGHRYLLEAMPAIIAAIPTARLLIVGDGPEEQTLRHLAKRLNIEHHVTFAGRRRDIALLLGMADVFVFPSIAEGLGIALIEAMASRLPVIASRVEGIREVLTDGIQGVLIPPERPEAIQAAVRTLYANPQARVALGRAARTSVEQRFSVTIGIARLHAFYRRIMTTGGPVVVDQLPALADLPDMAMSAQLSPKRIPAR